MRQSSAFKKQTRGYKKKELKTDLSIIGVDISCLLDTFSSVWILDYFQVFEANHLGETDAVHYTNNGIVVRGYTAYKPLC